jgi:hypothetical protein
MRYQMSCFSIVPVEPKFSRRRWLTVGGLAALSPLLGLAGVPAAVRRPSDLAADASFGRAKRCLLLFLTGGPPQHDTWDPKPDAPANIRGEFSPIATSAPGVLVSELFPRLAEVAHQFRIIRSLTHSDTVHTTAGYAMLTGAMHPQANQVASATMIRPSATDRPHVASMFHKFLGESQSHLPPFALPEVIKDAAVNEFPGLNSGLLSKRHEPVLITANSERTGFPPPSLALPGDVSLDRLRGRLALRASLNSPLDRRASQQVESHYGTVFDLIRSKPLQRAFQLDLEPAATREAYGSHLFGQGVLLARRLLEADARFVTVYWHYEGPDDSPVWDTHWNNFRHMRERLAPPTDQAVAALLVDLSQRGLLDETLVLCLGEFGRTPTVNGKAGRDHWPYVANALVAGAGVPGGTVVGASDKHGAYPAHTPITPEDWGATLLHWLGVDPQLEMHDQLGRPHRLGMGHVRPEVFG